MAGHSAWNRLVTQKSAINYGYGLRNHQKRQSARAASRLNLNVLRFASDLCELNRLWNEAWIEANFCRLCMRLNQCIVRSYGLLNLCTRRSTTLNCFFKLAFGMNGIPICTATSHAIGPSAPLVKLFGIPPKKQPTADLNHYPYDASVDFDDFSRVHDIIRIHRTLQSCH